MKIVMPLRIFVAVILSVLTLGANALAAEKECFSKDKADEFANQFSFFGVDSYDRCDDNDRVIKIFKAFEFLQNVEGTLEMEGVFGQKLVKDNPFAYFQKRVKDIRLEDECDGVMTAAYVSPMFLGESMFTCPHMFKLSTVEIAALLVHEARHLDGDEYNHKACTNPRSGFTGEYACDETFSNVGSYGIQVAFFNKISKANVSPEIKRIGRLWATTFLVSRFNTLPGDLKLGAFLTDANNKVSFYNGKSLSDVLKMKKGNILVDNLELKMVVSKKTAEVTTYTNGLSEYQKKGEGGARDSEFLGGAERIATEGRFHCALYASSVNCYAPGFDDAVVSFKKNKPRGIFAYWLGNQYELIIVFQNKKMMKLPSTLEEIHASTEDDLEVIAENTDMVKMQNWIGERQSLNLWRSGQITFTDRINNKNEAILPGKTFIDIIAPVPWSKSLQAL
ncbi:hypothetical protein [Bdellovibrio sp. HCB288]|uniref:hypothetical protein n=1 Tax=Bdellovibrio sp. HCB288 TaxID=3394355 RepID=UPI0039B4707C